MTQNLGNLFIDGEGVIEDESTTGHVITNTNVTLDTGTFAKGSSSLKFVGSSSANLSVAASSEFTFGTGDFTIDFWIKIDSSSGTRLIYQGTSGGNDGVQSNYSSQTITSYFNNGSPLSCYSADMNDNNWHHFALTRASGVAYTFWDGVLKNSGVATQNLSTSGPVVVGGYNTTWITAWYDVIRVVKGEALWTENFSLNNTTLRYPEEIIIDPYVRPDNMSELYNTKQMKLRGKSSEGFIRPTISQFFTSKNFEDILRPVPIIPDFVIDKNSAPYDLGEPVNLTGAIQTATNQALIMYAIVEDGMSDAHAQIITANGTSITKAAPVSIYPAMNSFNVTAVKLSATKYLVGAHVSELGGLNRKNRVFLLTISGNSVVVTDTDVLEDGYNNGISLTRLTDTKAVVVWRPSGTPARTAVVSTTGDNISIGPIVDAEPTGASGAYFLRLSENKVLISYSTSAGKILRFGTVTGNSIVYGDAIIDLVESTSSLTAFPLSESEVMFVYSDSVSETIKLSIASIDNDSLTVESTYTIANGVFIRCHLVQNSSTEFVIVYEDSITNDGEALTFVLGDGEIGASDIYTFIESSNVIGPWATLKLDTDKILTLYRNVDNVDGAVATILE